MNKFHDWHRISSELNDLKREEARLRRELCAEIFNGLTGREFNVKKIIDGFRVTATQKIITSIDEAIFENIYPELSMGEKSAVKFKPSIKKSIYEKLPIGLLHQAIIEKPAMPILKMEEI